MRTAREVIIDSSSHKEMSRNRFFFIAVVNQYVSSKCKTQDER